MPEAFIVMSEHFYELFTYICNYLRLPSLVIYFYFTTIKSAVYIKILSVSFLPLNILLVTGELSQSTVNSRYLDFGYHE